MANWASRVYLIKIKVDGNLITQNFEITSGLAPR